MVNNLKYFFYYILFFFILCSCTRTIIFFKDYKIYSKDSLNYLYLNPYKYYEGGKYKIITVKEIIKRKENDSNYYNNIRYYGTKDNYSFFGNLKKIYEKDELMSFALNDSSCVIENKKNLEFFLKNIFKVEEVYLIEIKNDKIFVK